MAHRIGFSPEAKADLTGLYDFIADRAGEARALGYIVRIEKCCLDFASFPKRGARRDDIRRGLRVVGFERRVTIAFRVDADTVTILRILYGGRDLAGALAENE